MKKRRKGIFHWLFSLIKIVFLVSLLLAIYFCYKAYYNVKQVETYRGQVEELTKEYNIAGHEKLVLAIIYTESKGVGTDLMQSSESFNGKQESVSSQTESLEQGVKYLSQAIQQADEAGCDLNTAIQAYNFGLDYISYIQANGGTNSVKLADNYSKNVLAPLLGNEEQKSYRYWQLPAIIYNGGYLYKNGGNLFYADVVQSKETVIDFFEIFF